MNGLKALFPFLKHGALFGALQKRELALRYRSSFLGNLWMVVTPLLMLGMYTFVFGVIFKSRWQGLANQGVSGFAIVLFSGLLLHTLLADTIGRAPALMMEQPNYVTKVVFPLELLPWVSMATALVHFAVGLVLLLGVMALIMPPLHLATLWLPVIVLPYTLYLVGLTWALAAVGVYLRDLAQFMTSVVSMLLFLSPIFYHRSQAPGVLGDVMVINPLTVPVEQARRVLFTGKPPEWGVMLVYTGFGLVVYVLGLVIFQRLRRGFSDVM